MQRGQRKPRKHNKDLETELRKIRQAVDEQTRSQRAALEFAQNSAKTNLTKSDLKPLTALVEYLNRKRTQLWPKIKEGLELGLPAVAFVVALFSLGVSLDAAGKYEITSTFGTRARLCGSMETGPLAQQLVVITNNGRLPITIVDVYDNYAREHDIRSSFTWTSLSAETEVYVEVPAELDVGEAMAVLVAVEGTGQRIGLFTVTSDGNTHELQVAPAQGDLPMTVSDAFERLHECELAR